MPCFLRSPASFLWLVLAFALSGAPSFAQGKISFDPARDLENFSTASSSEYEELYALEEFRALLAREMSPAELEEVRARWKVALQAGETKVRELESDPARVFRYRLRRQLARSSYFSKVKLGGERAAGPWTIFVEEVFKGRADPSDQIAGLHGPWLEKLAQIFDTEIVRKLDLSRRPDYGGLAVVVLDGARTFGEYLDSHALFYMSRERAVYDPRLRIVVTYDDPSEKDVEPKERALAVMQMGFRALLHAHFTGPGQLVPEEWICAGLASYLCWTPGSTPASLDRRTTPDHVYQSIAALLADPRQRETVLYSLEDLPQVHSYESILEFAKKRAEGGDVDLEEAFSKAYLAFFYEAAAWTQFLYEGHDAKYRPCFERYLRRALAGEGNAAAMRESFKEAALERVEKEFWEWTVERCRKIDPKLSFDAAFLSDLTKQYDRIRTASDEASFQPSALALAPHELEAHRGRALARARRGDLDGALVSLKQIQTAGSSPVEGIAGDLTRLSGAIALRNALLERLPEQRIGFELKGRKYANLKVEKVEGGILSFASNKQGIDRLPVAELPFPELVKLSSKKEWQDTGPDWARAYLLLLAGDANWSKKLGKDAASGAHGLANETIEALDRLVSVGEMADRIDTLSRTELPMTAEKAKAALVELEALSPGRGSPPVAARRPLLATLARMSLRAQADEIDPAELLRGKITKLEGGSVRVSYEFDKPVEQEDFLLVPDYVELASSAPPLELATKPAFQVEGGSASFSGSGFWRHRLPLAEPIRLKYTYRILVPEDSLAQRMFIWHAHLCDDLKHSAIMVNARGSLAIRENNGKARDFGPSPHQTMPNTDYEVRIIHENGSVKTYIDGEGIDGSPAYERKSGHLGFFVHSDLVFELQRVEMEGAVPKDGWNGAREVWCERMLERMGF
ncbi:MAG: hypothetical protein ACKVXR_01015 [Planctomycetota bacterium]